MFPIPWKPLSREYRGFTEGEVMSAEAIATLQKLWEKLVIVRVKRTIAREPEDVMSIDIPQLIGHNDDGVPIFNGNRKSILTRRTADIPREDRWCARIAWRHYYGFTDDNIYFDLAGYQELDFDIECTCDWSGYGNHTGGFDKRPVDGQLIAGIVVNSPRGRKFEKWFVVTPELRFLIELVRAGKTDLTEDRLARKLLTDGFPDTLWALVRLVFFDNVESFVGQNPRASPVHPCYGEPYGSVQPGGKRYLVKHVGMYLPMLPLRYVHQLSHRLKSPQWWKTVVETIGENATDHVDHCGYCAACDAQRMENNPYVYSYAHY